MSLIVLYFLHSTSVLSFYIDVVLTLSINGVYPLIILSKRSLYAHVIWTTQTTIASTQSAPWGVTWNKPRKFVRYKRSNTNRCLTSNFKMGHPCGTNEVMDQINENNKKEYNIRSFHMQYTLLSNGVVWRCEYQFRSYNIQCIPDILSSGFQQYFIIWGCFVSYNVTKCQFVMLVFYIKVSLTF